MSAPIRYFLFCFEHADQPSELRDWFRDNHGFELQPGTWVVPWQQHYQVLAGEVQRRLGDNPSGFVAVSARSETEFCLVHGMDHLLPQLKSIGFRPETA